MSNQDDMTNRFKKIDLLEDTEAMSAVLEDLTKQISRTDKVLLLRRHICLMKVRVLVSEHIVSVTQGVQIMKMVRSNDIENLDMAEQVIEQKYTEL